MDYEKNSIEILKMLNNEAPFVVADSGGKDSSVLTHIALKAGVKFRVIHNHTTVDAPETVYFVRNKFKKLNEMGICTEISYPKKTMWELIVKKKLPPTRLKRYCCSELKETYGKGEKLVTGVRKAESRNRRKNQGAVTFLNAKKEIRNLVDNTNFIQTNKGGIIILNLDNDEKRRIVETCYRTNKTLINPLIDWEDDFIKWYIKHEGIEINPLYSRGWKRVGCIGCPMASKKQRIKEFSEYPKYKQLYIHAFDRMIEERKRAGLKVDNGWKTGKHVFEWWLESGIDPDQIQLDEILKQNGGNV